MVSSPIWKDTFYTFNSNDKRFRIMVDGESKYEGRAKAKPDSDYATICVNKICQNYLENSFEGIDFTSTGTVVNSGATKLFALYEYRENVDTWYLMQEYRFLYDWDNEFPIVMSATTQLSIPINNHYADNQVIPTTVYGNNSVSTTIRYRNNSEPLYCGDYCLFYRNLAGGWDTFLFEGKCRKSDGFKYQQIDMDYNNNPSSGYEFNKKTYLNEITHKWELNTGYLSDAEGEIFVRQLCSSTECYLQDLRKGLIYPVVITDTEMKYKKYFDDGTDPVSYKIQVESSHKNIEFN